MSSALTIIVLGHASFFGALPNTYPIPPNSAQIRSNNQIPTTPQPQSQLTPAPYRENRRSDYTYTPGAGAHKLFTSATSWISAEFHCIEDGGHLAIIDSVAELNAITRLLKPVKPQVAWLGANDLYKEGKFVTIEDEPLAIGRFNVWDSGEPNNAGSNEDCVMVTSAGKLNDLPCRESHYFICELP